MSELDDVLEQNLARLFERAYRPVRPTTEFRAKLARSLEHGPSALIDAPRLLPARRLAPRLLTAAAVVLALAVGFLAWRATNTRGATPAEIVARGCVALRFATDEGWREIDAADAARGLDLEAEASVSIHTPPDLGFQVREGSSAVVSLAAASHATVEIGRAGHSLSLLEGALRIDNLAGRDDWKLTALELLELARGSLSMRVAECETPREGPCLFALLFNGEAQYFDSEGRGHALQCGVEVALHGGELLSASVGAVEPMTANHRQDATVANGSTAPLPTKPAPNAGLCSITGTIVRAAGDPSIGAYTVTLLRRQRLPAVSTPQPHGFDGAETFEIHGLLPGTYDVYVERTGRAVWRALGVEMAADETRELTVESTPSSGIRGRVVAEKTGAPIENALVIVEDDVPAQVIQFDADASAWSAAVRTDSNGEFKIDNLSAGAHVLRATAVGFGAAWSPRSDLSTKDEIVLRLPEPGQLAGRVAHEDGRAWSGAVVIASFMRTDGGFDRFSFGMGVADADGQYSIGDLPAGDYVLLNVLDTSPGRASVASRQVHVNAGAKTIANLPETLDGPRFHGRVLDSSGAALGGLDVTLQPHGVANDSNWRSQRTDSDGRFAFTGLPSTTYDVYVGESLGERFVWVEELSVPASGEFEHDIRVGAGSIHGRAVSKEAVIDAAFVVLLRAERDTFLFAGRVRTDAQGAFTFERLQPSTYRVIVYPAQKGLAPGTSADLWIANNAARIECELTIERGAALTVVVRDVGGAQIANVPLSFVDAGGHAQTFRANDVTGPDGRYAIDGLAAGRWTVSARTRDSAAITQNIELNVGDERELVLTLP